MNRPPNRTAVAVTMLLSVLALAARGWAGVDVTKVAANGYPTVHAVAVTSKPVTTPPTVSENGVDVVARAQNLASQTNVVLAIDRSQSMLGQPLADASRAAQAFVDTKPASNRVAIVAVGSTAEALTGFSSSTIDADGALRVIAVDSVRGTALYDSVVLSSARLLHVKGGRVLVLLTDGQEVSSKASLGDAIAAAKRAGVQVYPIAIQGPAYRPAPLKRLAAETGGTFYTASSTSVLSNVYAAIAAELARTWTIEYETAVRPGMAVNLQIDFAGEGSAVRHFSIPSSVGAPAPAKPMFLPASVYKSPLATLVLVLAFAALLLLAVVFFGAARKASWVRSRLDAHLVTDERRGKRRSRRSRGAAVVTVLHGTERVLGRLRQWSMLRRALERADLPLRPAEFAWISLGSGILFALIAGAVTGTPMVAGIGFLGGLAVPYGFVWFKARQRLAAFENQLPDLLLTIAASLKAGHSFRQGIQTIVEEGQAPAADEFKRVLTDNQLGRSMEDSLIEMADRVGSKNFEFVITAVTIQRQVGGSLAGLFDMVADTVRQRQQFARRIKSLTAMGRMSAYVLIGLPFFMVAVMSLINGKYMAPLFHTSKGHVMIVVSLAMMMFGSLILKKIVSFKG